MKRSKLFDITLLLFFTASIGYFIFTFLNQKSKVNLSENPKTVLKWQKDTIIDLGYLTANENVNFSTQIYNSGNHPLHIQDIKTSCGCTKAKFSKIELSSNDSATISGSIKTSKNKFDFIVVSFKSNTKQHIHNLTIKYQTK